MKLGSVQTILLLHGWRTAKGRDETVSDCNPNTSLQDRSVRVRALVGDHGWSTQDITEFQSMT